MPRISSEDPRVRIITTRTEIKVGRIGRNGPRLCSPVSTVFHQPSRRRFLYFLSPGFLYLLPVASWHCGAGGGGQRKGLIGKRATESRVTGEGTGAISRLILAGLTPRHVLRIKLLFHRGRVHRYGKSLALAIKFVHPQYGYR